MACARAEEDPYALDIELSLEDFVESYTLPQTVKVTEGFCDEEVEYSNGEVMHIHSLHCPAVELRHLSRNAPSIPPVPTDHPTVFQVIPTGRNNPVAKELSDQLLRFRGVTELAKYRPLCVKLLSEHGYLGTDQGYVNVNARCNYRCVLEAGDRLHLLRFKRVAGVKYLECKSIEKNSLVLLDVKDSSGEFLEVPPFKFLTLTELTSLVPSVRRLQVADLIQNRRNPIPGLGMDPDEVLIMSRPRMLLHVSPVHSLGTQQDLWATEKITVSPRQDTYESAMVTGLSFKQFCQDNEGRFPLEVRIVDWSATNSILEYHQAIPGRTMTLCKKIESGKFVARDEHDRYYAIPASYGGEMTVIRSMKQKTCVEDIRRVKGLQFRCHLSSELDAWMSPQHRVQAGEVYEITSPEVQLLKGYHEIDALQVHLVTPTARVRKFLPLNLQGDFEELTSVQESGSRRMNSLLESDDVPYPLQVEFISRCPHVIQDHDPIPLHSKLLIEYYAEEESVVAWRAGFGRFCIPLRAQIIVAQVLDYQTITRGNRTRTPMPPQKRSAMYVSPELLSESDCAEMETARNHYEDMPGKLRPPLLKQRSMSQPHDQRPNIPYMPRRSASSSAETSVDESPPMLPAKAPRPYSHEVAKHIPIRRERHNYDSHSIKPTRPPPPPPSDSKKHEKTNVKTNILNELKAKLPSLTGSSKCGPKQEGAYCYVSTATGDKPQRPRAPTPVEEDEDKWDYERPDGLTPPCKTSISIPLDGDLRAFSCEDMLSLLTYYDVAAPTRKLWRARGYTGAQFGNLPDEELRELRLDQYPELMRLKGKQNVFPGSWSEQTTAAGAGAGARAVHRGDETLAQAELYQRQNVLGTRREQTDA